MGVGFVFCPLSDCFGRSDFDVPVSCLCLSCPFVQISFLRSPRASDAGVLSLSRRLFVADYCFSVFVSGLADRFVPAAFGLGFVGPDSVPAASGFAVFFAPVPAVLDFAGSADFDSVASGSVGSVASGFAVGFVAVFVSDVATLGSLRCSAPSSRSAFSVPAFAVAVVVAAAVVAAVAAVFVAVCFVWSVYQAGGKPSSGCSDSFRSLDRV